MKILRAYTGTSQCGVKATTHTPDGRTNQINRKCDFCGKVFVLLRDKSQDRPLKTES